MFVTPASGERSTIIHPSFLGQTTCNTTACMGHMAYILRRASPRALTGKGRALSITPLLL